MMQNKKENVRGEVGRHFVILIEAKTTLWLVTSLIACEIILSRVHEMSPKR